MPPSSSPSLSSKCSMPTLVVLPPDLDASDVRSLLEFAYRGETAVDGHRVGAIIRAAAQLEIKGLCSEGLASVSATLVPPLDSSSGRGGGEDDSDELDVERPNSQLSQQSSTSRRRKSSSPKCRASSLAKDSASESTNGGKRLRRSSKRKSHKPTRYGETHLFARIAGDVDVDIDDEDEEEEEVMPVPVDFTMKANSYPTTGDSVAVPAFSEEIANGKQASMAVNDALFLRLLSRR